MSFDVAYSTDGGSTYTDIDYQDFAIDYGVSDVLIAPIASVQAARTVSASTGDRLRIQENGTTRFEGRLTTGGKVTRSGQAQLEAEHDIYPVFADSVSVTVSNPTDEDVYNAALSAANGGGGFTLNYVGTPVSLGDNYSVEDRSVKRIFRDMTDRTDRVFFVGVGDTITVAERGGGGQFASVSSGDSFRVEQYNPGDINTVRNAVTVNGTGAERVTATAEDSTSISDFGRRAETFNYSYIRTATEAQDMADELLVPSPLASGEILLGQSIGGGATGEIVNQTLNFDDPQGSGASDDLTIERQIINPGSVTVNVGEGAGVSIANVNRDSKSNDDQNEPGSVYDSDRISDGAIESTKLFDGSVVTEKLADLAVELEKVGDGAIDTVKITDNAIEAPKILSGEVTAGKLNTDEARANRLYAGTIEAQDIASDTITANEIDTLDLDTGTLTIGDSGDEKIEFTPGGLGDETILIPETAGKCGVGTPGREFGQVYTEFARLNDGVFGDIFDEQIEIIPFGGGVADGTALYPTQDETCALGGLEGGSSKAFNSMRSHNFNTATPERLDAVDASEVTDYSFHEPPLCAAQNKDSSTESGYRRRNPSKTIEIGHITNYLFEVCKDQQSKIESLESAVDDLEDRLSKLEAQQ